MRMKSSSAELIVGSSQDIDDDLSDVEEVFIRDGRNGKSREIENKPLMPPRKKQQHKNSKTQQQLKALKNQYKRSRSKRHRCCEPFCYAILVILVILILAAIVLTLFPTEKLKLLFQNASPRLYKALLVSNVVSGDEQQMKQPVDFIEKVPCQNFNISIVWNRTFSKLNSEAPMRKSDLDGDGIEDVIIGFGIDDSMSFDTANNIPQCTLANGQVDLCEGGIMALNGLTGDAMWKYWSAFAIFSHFCKFDVNGDQTNDCIIAGPGGLLQAIDGKSGKLVWDFKRISIQTSDELDINAVNLYTVNILRDLDLDGTPDIVAAHTSERFGIREGHILLISGKTGKILRSISSPYKEEIFLPIQVTTTKDGTEYLLVLTGGQNTAGGVYKIRVDTFKNFKDDSDYTTVHRSSTGFLVPAVLTDLNNDGVDDIVVASFNSTVYAFNGATNSAIWSFSFPSSETVSDIVPGLFNNDGVTDFMIKYSTGPGFPIYYYSQTTIIDGLTGKALLDSAITDSGGSHSLLGGISLSLPYQSGDYFLHFQSRCKDKFDAKDPYKFVPNSDIIQQSRADTCMLRYNTSTVLMLSAINRCTEPPGSLIFSSDSVSLEILSDSKAQNIANLRQPQKHPKMRIKVPPNRVFQPQPPIEINKKQSNFNQQFPRRQPPQQEKQNDAVPEQVVTSESQKQKALKFREKQLAEDLATRRLKFKENRMTGFEDAENNENINDIMNKLSMMEIPRELKDDLISDDKVNDYDMYYDQSQQRNRLQPPRRGSNNRGIRSDLDYETPSTYETILHELEKNHKKQDPNSQTVKKVLDDSEVRKTSSSQVEPRAETLWDIEIEKENRESHKNEIRKRDAQVNQKILPSISSTGVLVNSLKNQQNSIDFIFTLNVRASEAFPPILTQNDIQCVEDKMAALDGSYQDDVINWRDTFLKECIENRISYIDQRPVEDKSYETQITVVRLSISCTCRGLNEKKEICASFSDVKQQKWTEYMGNQLDGTYNKA